MGYSPPLWASSSQQQGLHCLVWPCLAGATAAAELAERLRQHAFSGLFLRPWKQHLQRQAHQAPAQWTG